MRERFRKGTGIVRRSRAIPVLRGALASAALLLSAAGGAANADAVTVAFVGDQDAYQGARDVLGLVLSEGADLLVIQGDLGYGSTSQWIANHDEILGVHFPVLAVVGNHEATGWPTYRHWLEQKIAAVPDLRCEGRIGIKARCTFRGLSIVQGAPAIHEVPGVDPDDDYAGYIERALADDPNAWRICSWHKQQRDLQVGGKDGNATGWGVYEACREGGAIVATAHEHSYSRTFLMSDFSELRVAHRDDHLEIGPGRTFAFVSGLGGNSVRPQLRDGDWWASIYTATQGATYGALFCTFEGRRASCRFKAIDGAVPDRFTLETRNGLDPLPPVPDTDEPVSGAVHAPVGLEARVYSASAAELFWARADTPGMRYAVTRDGAPETTTDGTSHYVEGLSAGRSYAFEVVAIDPAGRRSAPASVTVRTAGDAAPVEPTSPAPDTDDGHVALGSTLVSGDIDVRLNVYDRSSYELIWARVTGVARYRLSSSDGRVLQDGEKVSRYFPGIDSAAVTDYRIEAIDAGGRTVRDAMFRVAPRRAIQLVSLD